MNGKESKDELDRCAIWEAGFVEGAIGVELDARPKRCLEQPRVGRCDAVPAKCIQIRGEQHRLVEPAVGDRFPRLASLHFGVYLMVPEHFQGLTLGIVIHAGELDER